MKTVVLAAGEGTRMRPLTANVPKPMLPVADRPLIAHALDAAVDAGASRFVLVVGYRGESVRSHFGDSYRDVPIEYVVQDDRRGTADALARAVPSLHAEPFVVLNGDSLYDPSSLTALYDETTVAAVGSYRVDNPSDYGVLLTTDDGRRVTGVVEKPVDPPSDLINVGAYRFPAEAASWLDVPESERGELELTDVLDRVCELYDVRPIPFERWLDVGRPWELLEANEWKLGELGTDLRGEVSDGANLYGPVVVEEGARIRPGVMMEGPVLVRKGAVVGPNAFVRGPTLIGPDSIVGNAVEVKNSLLLGHVGVGHLSYVGDSILGFDTNLGAGTKIANLRHDGGDVRISVDGERVSTGRRKFGVLLGDGAKTGINTSLNSGVCLSAGARTMPGEVVLRDR